MSDTNLSGPRILGEHLKINLYTMGAGDRPEEKFGHAALCIHYPASPEHDLCFNYGTANFSRPLSLGWNYLRARAKFWVSTISPEYMLEFYTRRNRSIWVQEIPASPEQAQAIADALWHDSLEENRYYVYHHFFDNCTTRIRDLLDQDLGKPLSAESSSHVAMTFRDLSRRGFSDSPAILLASDFLLGRVGDRHPTEYEAMFLPEVLRAEVRSRLGVAPVLLYEGQALGSSGHEDYLRLYAMIFAMLLTLPVWRGYWKGSIRARSLVPVGILLTLLGMLTWAGAILSPLPMLRYNEALLLYFPLDFLAFFRIGLAGRFYCQVRVVIALLAIMASGAGLLSQPLWAIAALPVLGLLPLALPVRDTQPPAAHEE